MGVVEKAAQRYLQANSAAAVKLLQVMAKGGGKISTLDIDLLEETLGYIGWSVNRGIAARVLSEKSDIPKYQWKPWMSEYKADSWGYSGVKEPTEFWFKTAEEAARAYADFPITAGKPPANPVISQIYIEKISTPYLKEGIYPRHIIKTENWWMGVPSFSVTHNSETSPEFPAKVDDRGRIEDQHKMQPAAFWTYAYKHGLQQAAVKALEEMGAETVADLSRPPSARSLEHTGTCPVCFRNIKLINDAVMTRHGWEVQGDRGRGSYGGSWHTGPCYGYNHKPFELSSEGTAEYLKRVLDPMVPKLEADLQRLKKRPPEIQDRRDGKKFLLPTKSTPEREAREYEKTLERLISLAEREQKDLDADIKKFNERIKGWELKSLPGDRVKKVARPVLNVDRRRTYYHGTTKIQEVSKIMQEGLVPPELGNSRSFLTPVRGKVYLTKDLTYAVMYALGGDIAGHDHGPFQDSHFYGYLFVIPGKNLIEDIQPDEDFIGEQLYKALNGNGEMDPDIKHWLISGAKAFLSENQIRKVKEGEYIYWAAAGKKLLKHLSPLAIDTLMCNTNAIAHTGKVMPTEAWKIDRRRSKELKRDGSNFFEIAERVHVAKEASIKKVARRWLAEGNSFTNQKTAYSPEIDNAASSFINALSNPDAKHMVGPSTRPDEIIHTWVIMPDGTLDDPTEDLGDYPYYDMGIEFNIRNYFDKNREEIDHRLAKQFLVSKAARKYLSQR